MNYIGIISLLIIVATAVWWGGQDTEKEPNNNTNSYQSTTDSTKNVADSEQSPSTQPTTNVEASPQTVDPGTGKTITVYDGISVSEGTIVLNLSGRGLTGSLKSEVRFLSSLKELNLSENNFTGLPAEVGQLSQLEILNLSNNPFTGLPLELGNLKNLRVLDLRGTQYAKQDLEVIKKSLPASTQILID